MHTIVDISIKSHKIIIVNISYKVSHDILSNNSNNDNSNSTTNTTNSNSGNFIITLIVVIMKIY